MAKPTKHVPAPGKFPPAPPAPPKSSAPPAPTGEGEQHNDAEVRSEVLADEGPEKNPVIPTADGVMSAADRAKQAAEVRSQEKKKVEAGDKFVDKFKKGNDGKISAPTSPINGPIMVRALDKGYYGGTRLKPGQVFGIASMDDFGSWMELAEEIKKK
jgi:hypothetical protein